MAIEYSIPGQEQQAFRAPSLAERNAQREELKRKVREQHRLEKEMKDQKRREPISLPHGISGVPGELLRSPDTADQALAAAREVYFEFQARSRMDAVSLAENRSGVDKNILSILEGLSQNGPALSEAKQRAGSFLRTAAGLWRGMQERDQPVFANEQSPSAPIVVYEMAR